MPHPTWLSLRSWLPLDVDHPLCADFETGEESAAQLAKPVSLPSASGNGSRRRTCPILAQNPSPSLSAHPASEAPSPSSKEEHGGGAGQSSATGDRKKRPPLPALSFALSQQQQDALTPPRRVEIPLEALVFNEPGVGEVLCVVPQPNVSIGSQLWRQVRLGSRGKQMPERSSQSFRGRKMPRAAVSKFDARAVCASATGRSALSTMQVVVDRAQWRVGVKPKEPSAAHSDALCASKAACRSAPSCPTAAKVKIIQKETRLATSVCSLLGCLYRGDQVYLPWTNACVDPHCGGRWLFELNQESKYVFLAAHLSRSVCFSSDVLTRVWT